MINDERTTVYNQDDISTSIRNASRTLDWTDNGKQLKCVAGHIALDKPKETEKILWVECEFIDFTIESSLALINT